MHFSRIRFLLACAFLSMIGLSHAQIHVDSQAMLQAHNQVRTSVGIPPLKWSNKLSAYAQEWANHLAQNNRCEMEHRTEHNNPLNSGENIYWHSALMFSNGKREAMSIKPQQVVHEWASEKAFYSYTSNRCQSGEQCGHYTQIVWQNTTAVGCAASMCSDKGQIWVCNYDPAGNWQGQRPY